MCIKGKETTSKCRQVNITLIKGNRGTYVYIIDGNLGTED